NRTLRPTAFTRLPRLTADPVGLSGHLMEISSLILAPSTRRVIRLPTWSVGALMAWPSELLRNCICCIHLLCQRIPPPMSLSRQQYLPVTQHPMRLLLTCLVLLTSILILRLECSFPRRFLSP